VRLQLTWVGHSGLRVEHDGFVLVIDPGLLSAADAVDGPTRSTVWTPC
jgi:L-ascorbate metabolism protein UlaG (beta-lactamase superfamily)